MSVHLHILTGKFRMGYWVKATSGEDKFTSPLPSAYLHMYRLNIHRDERLRENFSNVAQAK